MKEMYISTLAVSDTIQKLQNLVKYLPMGHRSSKPTAGLTDGNTSNTKKNTTAKKLSKQTTRRHSTRFPKSRSSKNDVNNIDKKNCRHSIAATLTNNSSDINSNLAAALYEGNQFLPILQLESDSIAENTAAAVVNNSAGGQIIIKIRFKTHKQSEMDDTQQRTTTTSTKTESPTEPPSSSVGESRETYRLLTDTNSNEMMQVEDVEVRRAAGSSFHAMLNNNNNVRASLPIHLSALRITEPLREEDDTAAVEYHEINEEEASTSRRNRPDNSSRRQKAKSAFMNFKSKFESASHNGSNKTTQLSKASNVINFNNNNNNRTGEHSSCTNHHSYSSIPQRQATAPISSVVQQKQLPIQLRAVNNGVVTTTKTACNVSSIYHDTPLRNLTSTFTSITPPTSLSITTTSATAIATALPTQPPIITTTTTSNPQLAIWTTNSKDVIISSINLLVCPSAGSSSTTTGGVTLERLMATELAVCPTTSSVGGVLDVSTSGGQVSNSCSEDKSTVHAPKQISSNSTTPGTSAATATMVTAAGPIVHSQVDFVHYLVPDLERIFNSSFYWGKMDRYEAERLLESKPEGTFLLRDSAQEEYLFSVTFRKYGRSLHARIEQNGHKFSFDCHDPAVFSTSTVTGLLEHYKDPGSVMFFEPMLTVPFHRKTVFSLQQLARAAIVSNTSYDGITELELPVRLKAYLKEYHYKQKLRVKLLEETLLTCT